MRPAEPSSLSLVIQGVGLCPKGRSLGLGRPPGRQQAGEGTCKCAPGSGQPDLEMEPGGTREGRAGQAELPNRAGHPGPSSPGPLSEPVWGSRVCQAQSRGSVWGLTCWETLRTENGKKGLATPTGGWSISAIFLQGEAFPRSFKMTEEVVLGVELGEARLGAGTDLQAGVPGSQEPREAVDGS